MGKKRRVFEQGHQRKFLVVVDDSSEVESALYYAALRISHTSGRLLLLYVIEPQEYQHWAGIRQVQLEEETNKAKALFRLMRRKLNNAGFDALEHEEVIVEGTKSEQIVKVIEEDEDIAILVLGASTDPKGPGPLVTAIGSGQMAGNFVVPITIVPGNLGLDDLKAFA